MIKLCFVKNLNVRSLISNHLDKNWITVQKVEELYEIIYIHLKSEHPPVASIILNEIKDSEERNFLSGLLFDLEDIEGSMKMAKDCLIRLEEHYLKNKHINLREKLKSETDKNINDTINEISIIENSLKNVTLKYDDVKEI